MAKFLAMLGTGLENTNNRDPIKSEYIEASPVASTDLDIAITTKAGGQNKILAPEASSSVDPATVSSILPEASSWPSVTELTTYPTSTGPPTVMDIGVSEASPSRSTSPIDATTSYNSSLSPIPSTTLSSSNSSSLKSTVTTSTRTITSASETTSAITDATAFSGGPSKTTKIAIAVPVSVIGLALILALLFFLSRRRRRNKEPNGLPPSYDIATGHRSAVSTQELMISPKSSTPEPRYPLSTPAMSSTATAMALPMPRIPIISVSPSTESRGRTPSPSPSPSPGTSLRRMSMSRGPGDSVPELGVAVAVPMDRRRSATEHGFRGRVESVTSSRGQLSRGPSQLARMPFEDFSDDEVGIGIAHGGSDDEDAVSDVSDLDGRRRERDFDEHSVVSSFGEVSPIGEQDRRRFRGV
ncbi:uncharacterized protein N7479_000150 [Penicillium vulpinum]|uniref:Mid2 domain-containing protein n=1 Tax=Penicillium vulpinum TaxID=29845 RepID=A0A1V6RXM3_9EURO|nr:uncharacterized protein N7479_000150 [Penicillium vulpinum]KAJ5970232.1 hypothetical protein N7479_000150 [Penicillium vulpinum]OQE06280.1 hypothetical protein PENVUL_c019G06248 [Penicillium vulpinum]